MDKEMKTKNDGGRREDAWPQQDEMALYARAYRGALRADELFRRFEAHAAHSRLIEHAPEHFDREQGISCRQLAEGARIAARRMAVLLAEAPTALKEVLALKVHVFETLIQLPDEVARSNAAVMVEAAMRADGERAGVVLIPLDEPFRTRQ
jgi:hypothetical protein